MSVAFACSVPQFTLNEEATLQVGGGLFLGLGPQQELWKLTHTDLFLESPSLPPLCLRKELGLERI